jgi:dCMP deaminase
MWMEFASSAAKRSTCFRLNVGAIVVQGNRLPIAVGYNGQDPGAEHCQAICEPGECNTIHAEKNAIDSIKGVMRSGRLDLYVTDSPCMDCAIMIYKAGIVGVYYRTPYRDISPIHMLWKRGLEVYRVTPSGVIIPFDKDWAVRKRSSNASPEAA